MGDGVIFQASVLLEARSSSSPLGVGLPPVPSVLVLIPLFGRWLFFLRRDFKHQTSFSLGGGDLSSVRSCSRNQILSVKPLLLLQRKWQWSILSLGTWSAISLLSGGRPSLPSAVVHLSPKERGVKAAPRRGKRWRKHLHTKRRREPPLPLPPPPPPPKGGGAKVAPHKVRKRRKTKKLKTKKKTPPGVLGSLLFKKCFAISVTWKSIPSQAHRSHSDHDH